jgi:hypothetical protein
LRKARARRPIEVSVAASARRRRRLGSDGEKSRGARQALAPGARGYVCGGRLRRSGRQADDRRRCALKCSHPTSDTLMRRPRPDPRSRAMKPRSFASSHTGSRGHDVRQASSTSAYGRGFGPIHSRRSRIRLSTASSRVSYQHKTCGSRRRPDLPRADDCFPLLGGAGLRRPSTQRTSWWTRPGAGAADQRMVAEAQAPRHYRRKMKAVVGAGDRGRMLLSGSGSLERCYCGPGDCPCFVRAALRHEAPNDRAE